MPGFPLELLFTARMGRRWSGRGDCLLGDLVAGPILDGHSWGPPHCCIYKTKLDRESEGHSSSLESCFLVNRCARGDNTREGQPEGFPRLLSRRPGLPAACSPNQVQLYKFPIPAHPRTSPDRQRARPLPLGENSICHIHSFQLRELPRSPIPEEKAIWSTMSQKLKPGPCSCIESDGKSQT